jgi:hypothetical protein
VAPRRWHSTVGTVVLTGSLFLGSAGGAIAVADPDTSTATDSADHTNTAHSTNADDTGTAHSDVAGDSTHPADDKLSTGESAPEPDEDQSGTPGSKTWSGVDANPSTPTSDSRPVATSPEPATNDTTPPTDIPPAAQPTPVPAGATAPVTAAAEPLAPRAPVHPAPVTAVAKSPTDSPAPVPAAPTTRVPPPPRAIVPAPIVYPVLLPLRFIWAAKSLLNPIVTAAVGQLVQYSGDLYQMLLSMIGAQPPTGLLGATAGRPRPPSAASMANTPWDLLLLPHLDGTVPAARDGFPGFPGATGALSLLAHRQSFVGAADDPAETASVTAAVSAPPVARSWLEHATDRIDAISVPASLAVLAATALPGIGGLLILTAAGIRLGYRQAKAGMAIRVSAVARFLDAEPQGVVCSGSLVAFRPWPLRAVPPDRSREPALLGRAA